jgi:predicted unusual protein kinase regulating ubiquinone biosynthesis (AarF/ABC1/UbiB family)
LPSKICNAENIGENDNNVLIAPYINGGSIRNYAWNMTNIHILKSLLNQCIISLMYAYVKHGFLHNDLHLDNILLKRIKMEKVHYEGIDIVTNGYKVVIMDFDKSFINVDQTQAIQYFWSNLYNLLSRIKFDLKDKITAIKNFDNIILLISNAEVHKYDITKAVDLPKMIDDIIFVDSEPLTVPTYNPNITG